MSQTSRYCKTPFASTKANFPSRTSGDRAMTGLTMNLSYKQLDVGSGSRQCEINDDSPAIWPEDSMTRFARLFPQRLDNYLGEDNDPT